MQALGTLLPSHNEDGPPQSPLLLKQEASDEKVASPSDTLPDISSVITQVKKQESSSFTPLPALNTDQLRLKRPASWRTKFRTFLCCFAPVAAPKKLTRRNTGGSAGSKQGRMLTPFSPIGSNVMRPDANLIGPRRQEDVNKKTLVLDLDETLVHSSFKPIPSPDFVIPVEIDGRMVDVYVLKRPWLDHFMESIGDRFEVVVFTASLSKYADPLLDLLDKWKVVRWRLFREACLPYEGNYVKDLACLGRELCDTIIVDNSPHSYALQPGNALPIGTFIDNMEDQELLDLLPVLQQTEAAADVRPVLSEYMRSMATA